MSISKGKFFSVLTLFSALLFGQSDRGTITGTVADPAGAVVSGAPIQLKNTETGAPYEVASSATGNYTIANLPAGNYEMSVMVPGFKTYIRQNIAVQVAQTLRLDVALQVGQSTESVTVSAEVTLLKTESGELAHNTDSRRMNDLPLLSIGAAGAGSQGVRNPMAAAQLAPGTYQIPNNTMVVNGAPSNTMSIRVEGQEATNGVVTFAQAETQPSVDALQEVALQTSNYAAEFGQAGSGVFNYTMKSGTNSYHGTAYEYYVNEGLNAGQAYLNVKPAQRRHDFGGTIGGPVRIPHVYNGTDKTFFFINYERFHEGFNVSNTAITVPTAAYRAGNFATALTGRAITGPAAVDPLGRSLMEGMIFDPATERVVNGVRVRDQFPGNVIPTNRLDPVALKVQGFMPNPTTSGLVNNGIYPFNSIRNSPIPAFKIDHFLNTAHKLSFYWSSSETNVQYCQPLCGSEGLPDQISQTRGTFIESYTTRLNYDWTVTPTFLLHLGAGFASNDFKDTAPITDFNAEKVLGLKGTTLNRIVPRWTGNGGGPGSSITGGGGTGGIVNLGPAAQSRSRQAKPTFIASASWVKGNHTYKFGGELRVEGYPVASYVSTAGQFDFSQLQTTNTSIQSVADTNGNVAGRFLGHPYASFLLGLPNSVNIAAPANSRGGKSIWGLYMQDSWKVTRKLTMDYGLRWDYFTYPREQYGRAPSFRPTVANPTADGYLGGAIFEATCNCRFANNYPWAFGPRIGAAYQINSKTVLRAGFGVSYSITNGGSQGSAGAQKTLEAPGFGDAAMVLGQGIPVTPTWPVLDPGLFPTKKGLIGSGTSGAPGVVDQNYGRPARQFMWSIGLQREIARNLVVEASYVANRGNWWRSSVLSGYNALTKQRLASFGLDATNAADRAILTSQIQNPGAGRFQNVVPYASFPRNASVAQSLRPFPQFGDLSPVGAPLGNTWYDSLQVKATKRLSHGLDFSYAFAFQKELALGVASDAGGFVANDVFNRQINKYLSQFSRPFTSTFAYNYQVGKVLINHRVVSQILRDWKIGGVLQYASGLPIPAPNSVNNLSQVVFQRTWAERVPGQPLFLTDLNSKFDPTRQLIFNPKAWTEPVPGTFSPSTYYYNDYRYRRVPQESMSFGRVFQLSESKSIQIRAEWTNIFNRLFYPNPTGTALTNYASATNTNAAGDYTAGFGWINTRANPPAPGVRQGALVVRFRF